MTRHVLQGPFLTRAEASRRARLPEDFIAHRADLLRVGGHWLQEVYFAFQFDDHGLRPDVARLVQQLKTRSTDRDIWEWLVRPNPELGFATPLNFLDNQGPVERVLAAAKQDGPPPAPEPSTRFGRVKRPPPPDHHVRFRGRAARGPKQRREMARRPLHATPAGAG